MKFNLDNLVVDYRKLEEELAHPDLYSQPTKLRDLMRKKKALQAPVDLFLEYKKAWEGMEESKRMLREESDAELITMAKEELAVLEPKITQLEEGLKLALLPKDPNDEKDVILEVRAGVGGDEAALFAGELLAAYVTYLQEEGFKTEPLDESRNDSGGIKEASVKVSGERAYSRLKFEAGTHRVQRVPTTEKAGRVHTSTVTVAVLPEADEVDVVLRDEDLDIMTCRSSGAGGQHVNKTESAIRAVHKPTGIVVECQDQRSQLKNKEKALTILRARIYAAKLEEQQRAQAAERLGQVGSGDRSEKIRTYNFPQDRITDHRINQNFSNIPVIMGGDLGEILDACAAADQAAKLAAASGSSK